MSNTLNTLRRIARFFADVVHFYHSPDDELEANANLGYPGLPKLGAPRSSAPHLANWDNTVTAAMSPAERTQGFVNHTIARFTGLQDDEDDGR